MRRDRIRAHPGESEGVGRLRGGCMGRTEWIEETKVDENKRVIEDIMLHVQDYPGKT